MRTKPMKFECRQCGRTKPHEHIVVSNWAYANWVPFVHSRNGSLTDTLQSAREYTDRVKETCFKKLDELKLMPGELVKIRLTFEVVTDTWGRNKSDTSEEAQDV